MDILSPGIHNQHAGPDFENARLRIGSTIWAGNVEIHSSSSDWFRHGHQNDPAYQNIILHVVHTHDSPVYDHKGIEFPTLELNSLLPKKLHETWEIISAKRHPIACAAIGKPDLFLFRNWLDRLLVERLSERSQSIIQLLGMNRNDWQEAFYVLLARSFGFHTNALPFEMLARSIPLNILMRHSQSRFQLEALLFGQAGFLEDDFDDAYPSALKTEYCFLRKKYSLNNQIQKHLWKFLRMRPVNFPTIRISQFAGLIEHIGDLLGTVFRWRHSNSFDFFEHLEASSYWENHYVFEKIAPQKKKILGKSSANRILLNAIYPFCFEFARSRGEDEVMETILDLIRAIPAETNSLINPLIDLGLSPSNAGETLALFQLRTKYCNQLKCLECAIGIKALNPS